MALSERSRRCSKTPIKWRFLADTYLATDIVDLCDEGLCQGSIGNSDSRSDDKNFRWIEIAVPILEINAEYRCREIERETQSCNYGDYNLLA